MTRSKEEAVALLCCALLCVLGWRCCFMSFSIIGVVSHFTDLWRGDLDIELERVSRLSLRTGDRRQVASQLYKPEENREDIRLNIHSCSMEQT